MRLVSWLFPGIVIWLFHFSNAIPGTENNRKTNVHFTNIGDISAEDLMRIADESTPADKRLLSPKLTDIETETNQYYNAPKNIDLTTPNDQEKKFVNILKKRYKGLFPEYGKETEADYGKNMELGENLDAQPETVVIGHSDMYNRKTGDSNDFQIPEDVPLMDNLDTFDSDSNLVNSGSQGAKETAGFHEKIQKTTKTPFHTTQRHQTDHEVENGSQNDYDANIQSDSATTGLGEDKLGTFGSTSADDEHEKAAGLSEDEMKTSGSTGVDDGQDAAMGLSEDEMETSGSTGVDDGQDAAMGLVEDELETPGTTGYDDEQAVASGNEGEEAELKNTTEQTHNESFGLKTKPSREKEENKEKPRRKEKLKHDNSSGIFKEFEEIKEHSEDTKEHTGTGGDSVELTHTGHRKHSRKIKHVHTAEDSRTTGDAILDFLDKLLEKDPVKLRHDVLSMAKEIQEEGDGSEGRNPSIMEQGNGKTAPGVLGKKKRKPQKTIASGIHHNADNNKEVDDWISEMEDGNDKEAVMSDPTGRNNDYENDEYNEFHDQSQDIYPDNNGGGEPEEPGNYGDVTFKAGKVDEKLEKKVKNQEYFDYEEFKEESLKVHNEFRKRHNAVALEWSEKLAKDAKESAVDLIKATRTSFKRELERHGQSIAILPYLTKDIAKTAVEKWYSEITKFSFADPELKPETRDFTQIIWKGSKKMGMGFGYSPGNKKTVVVALYTPAGNKEEGIKTNLNLDNNDPYADIRKADIQKHA